MDMKKQDLVDAVCNIMTEKRSSIEVKAISNFLSSMHSSSVMDG